MSRREFGYESRPENEQRPMTRADGIVLRIFYVGMVGVIVLLIWTLY
jgi:hypothetical protein